MAWLGLLIFILALIGYSGAVRYLGVSPYLAWITAILLQIIIDYLFAMVGFLRIGLIIVTITGVLLLVVRLIARFFGKVRLPLEEVHLFDFWMLGLGFSMANVLAHSPLIHYDNFSHWALIVKFLTFEGRFPGAHDTIIQFTSYPPATALWLTQFVTWVGFSDGTMLVAQFILIWASTYSIFGILRDRSRGLMSFILCFTIALSYVFNIAIRLNNLLVDYILPIITVAALVGIYLYRQQPRLLLAHSAVFIAALMLVKNSAAFFVVIIATALLVVLIRQTQGAYFKVSWRWLLTVGVSLLPFLWWQQHVHQTFTVSKHEISEHAYENQLATEGVTTIIKIGRRLLTQLNLNSLSFQGVLLINATLIIATLLIRWFSHRRTHLIRVLIILDIIFVLYFLCLYGMYVLSMPYSEAIVLDGYERYMSSVVVLNLFIAAMALVRAMDDTLFEQRVEKRGLHSFASIFTKNLYQMSTFILLIFSIIMMLSEINGTQFTNRYNRDTVPRQLSRIARPWTHYNHTRILVVDPHAGDVADYYVGFVAKYYFFTNQAVGRDNFMETPRQFGKTIQQYQYVAIPEYHYTFTVMMSHFYHQSNIRTGFFKVTPTGLQCVQK